MGKFLLAAGMFILGLVMGGDDNCARADQTEGVWRLFRPAMVPAGHPDASKMLPAIQVASFDYRENGRLQEEYNRAECEIIRGLVIADNATRIIKLDYICVKLPAGITPGMMPAIVPLPQ